MTISIESFGRAAAAGGLLNVNGGGEQGEAQVGKMRFGDRVAQWFPSGATRAANQKTTAAFVESLKQRYGESFSTRASAALNAASGKPLSARVVSDVIRQGDAHARQVAGLNRGTALRFTEDLSSPSPHSLGKVFADLAAQKGVALLATDPDLNLARLQHAIAREIGFAAIGNKVVSLEQARGIAEKVVGPFLDTKAELLRTCEHLSLDAGERALLRSFVLSHDIATPDALRALWDNRDAAGTLLVALGRQDAGTDATIGALNDYFLRYDAAIGPLLANNPKAGADDLVDFNNNLMELGLQLAAGGPASHGGDRPVLDGLWRALTRPEVGELRDALNHLYQNGVEAQIGMASMTALRTFNDTLGSALLQVGEALGKPEAEIARANTLQYAIEHVDAVPRPVIDALQASGLGDVNYTLEKQIDEMFGAAGDVLRDALAHLSLTREVRAGGDAAQMHAQLDVLNDRVGKLAAVAAPPQAAALAATLRAKFEEEIDGMLQSGAETARAGGNQDEIAAALAHWAARAADVGANVLPAQRGRFDELALDLSAEAYTRREPTFLDLDAEDQARTIANRQQYGRIIGEDLRVALDRDLQPGTRLASRADSDRLALRMTALRTGDAAGLAERMRAVDGISMGSSDTIAGKSGGGEVAGGADRATRNWRDANARAGEIVRAGQPLTLENIRELNRLLNAGMPANEGVPGEFRARPETAGGGPAYLTPERIPSFMEDFMAWLADSQGKRDPIELAGLAYQKLVSIHPFADANGRTCRLVADIILQRHGLPPAAFQGSDEVNVSVFAVPSGKNPVNLTPDDAVQRMTRAVQRSVDMLAGD